MDPCRTFWVCGQVRARAVASAHRGFASDQHPLRSRRGSDTLSVTLLCQDAHVVPASGHAQEDPMSAPEVRLELIDSTVFAEPLTIHQPVARWPGSRAARQLIPPLRRRRR